MNKIKLKSKFEFKKSDLILIIIILILIVTYIFIKIFTYKSEPLLLDYAKKESENIISTLINKSIKEVLYESEYEDLIEIEKDNDGHITNLNFNNKDINEILYLSTENLLNSILLLEKGKYNLINNNYISNKDFIYYIPIGVIHNLPVLINIGPKIPFKIDLVGSVNSDEVTSVKDYGINSSIIEVFLKISLNIQVILPFKTEDVLIEKNILLDSKIVQGKIPDYYGGLISNPINN